jgi:hypothetical protein
VELKELSGEQKIYHEGKKVCLGKIIPNNGTKKRNTGSKKSGTKICGANFEE